jgi:hypothetical protein
MKKILLVLVVVLSALTASAQKTAAVSSKALEAGKTTGTYVLVLPADITTADVDRVKEYYKEYFIVTYNEMKHEASLALTKNEAMNKRVVLRFLSALGMDKVKVEGQERTLTEFYENDLMK